ncbi:O-antigen ligase family protein [Pseudomonas sp. MM211]|uniref:O-antigen ligase family protein n=1 Tax=Pseudomonas sp. MM211 TaxID=2866808 RepID=UPI001CED6168|nr:O-antigen ligase family protein [Pseudomonas sp. MM211]UCJ16960.1 O-antigen ligase family protein [Pseudomonas sp. MM211]
MFKDFFAPLLVLVSICFFSSTAVVYWFFSNSWLEQQRIFQLLLLLVVLSVFLVLGRARLDEKLCVPWMLVFMLGAVSSIFAQYPIYGFYEWSKAVGLFFLVLTGGTFFSEKRWLVAVLFVASILCFLLAYQFILFYLMAFVSGELDLNPYVLYPGFDNPRFYSQVVIILLPLLVCLAALCAEKGRRSVACFIFFVCIVQWSLLIALAGRGSWLAVALANLIVLLFFNRFRKFLLLNLYAVIGGFLLYLLMFFLIPWSLGLTHDFPSGLRGGLSARDVLWSKALEMTFANPWLGVGPMHFSAEWNHIAAHPHQMVLQWAAEWGIPAASIAITLIAAGMWRGFQHIRTSSRAHEFDVAVWVSLCSALVLAQVDGVFVMPFTEGWLAVVAGVALSRWSKSQAPFGAHIVMLKVLALPALLVIVFLLIVDVPHIYEKQVRFWEIEKIGSPPRFWDQGWIPM